MSQIHLVTNKMPAANGRFTFGETAKAKLAQWRQLSRRQFC